MDRQPLMNSFTRLWSTLDCQRLETGSFPLKMNKTQAGMGIAVKRLSLWISGTGTSWQPRSRPAALNLNFCQYFLYPCLINNDWNLITIWFSDNYLVWRNNCLTSPLHAKCMPIHNLNVVIAKLHTGLSTETGTLIPIPCSENAMQMHSLG